jgi:hypothetical protein
MSNQIDKFFNDKLADHTVAPSAAAWQKVAANLSKKNKAIIWFRWAAALLLPVLLVGSILWFNSRNANVNSSSITKVQKVTSPSVNSGTVHSAVSGARETPLASSIVKTPTTLALNSDTVHETLEESALITNTDTSTLQHSNTPTLQHSNTPTLQHSNTSTLQHINTEKSIVLEYTLDSPEAPSPMSTEKAITVTIQLKEKKVFQKVMDFVRDSKNSEGPFATIRDAKDDLFAFNFKKDKPKNK